MRVSKHVNVARTLQIVECNQLKKNVENSDKNDDQQKPLTSHPHCVQLVEKYVVKQGDQTEILNISRSKRAILNDKLTDNDYE